MADRDNIDHSVSVKQNLGLQLSNSWEATLFLVSCVDILVHECTIEERLSQLMMRREEESAYVEG